MLIVLAVVGAAFGLAIEQAARRYGQSRSGEPNPLDTTFWQRFSQAAARHSAVRRLAASVFLGGAFAIAALRYDDPGYLSLALAYVAVLFACATFDIYSLRIPNMITYPAIAGALVVMLVLPEVGVGAALTGGLIGGALFFVPALLTGGIGIGVGDAKLAAFAGLALGIQNLVPAIFVMALVGGLVAGLLLVSGLAKRGEGIPYGPFIAAGAVASLLWRGIAPVTLG